MIVPLDFPASAGLTAPGAMYQSKTRVAFDSGPDPEAVEEVLTERFPDAGFDIRTRDRASPGAERFVGRMGEFPDAGRPRRAGDRGDRHWRRRGVPISSARRASVATLKILGATSGDIARIYALQVGAAALAGPLAGLAAGVLVTPLLTQALGDLLPVRTGLVVDPAALLRAALFGLLVALVFAAPPLMRTRHFPAMALMRSRVAPVGARLAGRGAGRWPSGCSGSPRWPCWARRSRA